MFDCIDPNCRREHQRPKLRWDVGSKQLDGVGRTYWDIAQLPPGTDSLTGQRSCKQAASVHKPPAARCTDFDVKVVQMLHTDA